MRTLTVDVYDAPAARIPPWPESPSTVSNLSSDGSSDRKTRSVHESVRVARVPWFVTVNVTGIVCPEVTFDGTMMLETFRSGSRYVMSNGVAWRLLFGSSNAQWSNWPSQYELSP